MNANPIPPNPPPSNSGVEGPLASGSRPQFGQVRKAQDASSRTKPKRGADASGRGGGGGRGASLFGRFAPPILQLGVTLAAIGCVTAALLWNTLFAQMPSLPSREALWEQNREPGMEFLDASGQTLAVRGPRYGRLVRLDELPDYVYNAFIAAEDKRFLVHEGVDYSAIVRAVFRNVQAGRTVQGGSTITQQLVKNLVLTSDQTLKRKAQEARLAIDLERSLTKEEILELYLNRIYLGAGAYGLDAAARTFFDRSPEKLSLAEAAVLAALPKAPTRFAASADTVAVRERQHYVLDQMVEARFITPEAAAEAKQAELIFANSRPDLFSGHALDFAVQQVHELLPNPPPDLMVVLTLDLDLQKSTQEAVERGIAKMGAEKQASEAAAILMEHSGAIRAIVGGRDYATSQFNRAVQARRQPGSAFKMFVYAAALESGLTPGDVRYDEPVWIRGWSPKNYGGSYRGAVTLNEAMQDSLNTVAASVGYEIGINKVTELARRFGIRTQLHNWPSVTLGSDEVTLLDITAGYGVIAKGGRQMSPYIVEEIRNSRGDSLFKQQQTEPAILYAPDLAEVMTGMLTRVVVQGTGRAARIPGWDVAGKTGTSQDWRDAWFIGFTGRYVGGVWVGNDDDRPMVKVTGGDMPAAIWADMIIAAQNDLAPQKLAGALGEQDMLTADEQTRLNFYRRLSSAFREVESRQLANADPGG